MEHLRSVGVLSAPTARRFVTVSSEFYPDLQAYYHAFVEEWLKERGLLEDPAGSGDDSASGREAC